MMECTVLLCALLLVQVRIDVNLVQVENRLMLGSQLEPGEYVLQVLVKDRLAPKKALRFGSEV
jgi:hypothetical protein